jgi:predicted nucleic acid-binding protein
VAALVDTNVLVYRFDPRFPDRQRVAHEVLRRGIAEDSVRIAHQALVEFVAVVVRPVSGGSSLLTLGAAIREVEDMCRQFAVLYPIDAVL